MMELSFISFSKTVNNNKIFGTIAASFIVSSGLFAFNQKTLGCFTFLSGVAATSYGWTKAKKEQQKIAETLNCTIAEAENTAKTVADVQESLKKSREHNTKLKDENEALERANALYRNMVGIEGNAARLVTKDEDGYLTSVPVLYNGFPYPIKNKVTGVILGGMFHPSDNVETETALDYSNTAYITVCKIGEDEISYAVKTSAKGKEIVRKVISKHTPEGYKVEAVDNGFTEDDYKNI